MPEPWRIRPACVDDAATIAALVTALTRNHIAPTCSTAGATKLLASMATTQVAERLRGDYRYYVATIADNSIVGVAAMRPPAHLYHLFVADALQGRGLGRALWHAVRDDFFAGHGAQPVTVNAARGAVAPYLRYGFVAQGPERVHDGVPSTPLLWTPPET